jgi:hypothetical protein
MTLVLLLVSLLEEAKERLSFACEQREAESRLDLLQRLGVGKYGVKV